MAAYTSASTFSYTDGDWVQWNNLFLGLACGRYRPLTEIEKFMSSRPVVMMVLQGTAVVSRVRDLLGPTDWRKAPKGTILGDFGTEMI